CASPITGSSYGGAWFAYW
nr:immunoglobulin heavy chain junction region [Mus musculus]